SVEFYETMLLMYLTVLVLASHMMLGDAAVTVSNLRASGLSGDAFGNRPDPYVKLWCNSVYGGRTDTIKDTTSPNWAGTYTFSSCRAGHSVRLEVWDQDLTNDDLLGSCSRTTSSGSRSTSCSLNKGTVYFSYSAN
uniref:Si:ch211-240l19.7 n=2 Tax=Astyanax mexicanus TaxID=7994 RepID=A0A8B9H6G2_ASTMX